MAAEAVVCVSCGFHKEQGRQMKTVVQYVSDTKQRAPKGVTVTESNDKFTITERGSTPPGAITVVLVGTLVMLLLFLATTIVFRIHMIGITVLAFVMIGITVLAF
ncbi:MAG: hypothetical protein CMJ48_12495, partial [Planctomycetaceae bacterium]|nr:hypothetical protein [Planctomycetaceae bacterium]